MKNPNRIAAGKINQKKRKLLTPEGKQRIQEAIRAHEPWRKSTGPTSDKGKAISKMNALKPKSEPSMIAMQGARILDRLRELIRLAKDQT